MLGRRERTLKRIVKSPKMYFMDTGLCAYLTRWSSAKTLEASMMSGTIFETYAVSEIIKSYYNAGKRPPVFYYRDTDQQEIDLILEADDTLYPFEMMKSAAPGKDAVRHFRVLEKTKKTTGTGGVICMTDSVHPIDAKNSFIPVVALTCEQVDIYIKKAIVAFAIRIALFPWKDDLHI